RLEALESGMLQPALHSGRGMARTNLEDVAGLPGVLRWRRQTKQERRRALAARVEQAPLDQRPALPGRLIETCRSGASQLAQGLLPAWQCGLVGSSHLEAVDQTVRARKTQPVADPPGETAEMLVLPVAQRQNGVAQLPERHGATEHLALEALRG